MFLSPLPRERVPTDGFSVECEVIGISIAGEADVVVSLYGKKLTLMQPGPLSGRFLGTVNSIPRGKQELTVTVVSEGSVLANASVFVNATEGEQTYDSTSSMPAYSMTQHQVLWLTPLRWFYPWILTISAGLFYF